MKKTIKILVPFALLAMSSSAFAEVTITTVGSSIGGGSFKTSTGVTLKAKASTTSYAATSQHMSSKPGNGGKQYGAISSDATIKSATAVEAGVPTSPDNESTLPSTFQ